MAKIGQPFDTYSASYRVIDAIGEGGAGYVYSVTDDSGTRYALKILGKDKVTKENIKRFHNELAFCKRDIHPNIVRIIDCGYSVFEEVKVPFYVMPLYGGTLRKSIVNGVTPLAALKIFAQLLDGIEAAHLNRVWHRDLKPENILLDPTGNGLVIADFGIAHFSAELLETSIETQPGSRLGNFCYAAPEQRRKGELVDQRADIFALGLILNELFTREVPLGTGHRTIGSVAADYSYLDSIVDEMIRQSPAERPSRIADIKKQLIGRHLEFVTLQEIDDKKRKVIQSNTPPSVPDIEFVGFDYINEELRIILNCEPPKGWMPFFANPPGGHSAIMGYGPEQFRLRGKILTIDVPERNVEDVVHHARDYAMKASLGLREQLAYEAAQNDRLERAALQQAVQEAETRARIVGRLNKQVGPG